MTAERPVRHIRHPSRYATPGLGANSSRGTSNDKSHSRPDDEATIAYIKRVLCHKPSATGSSTETPGDDVDSMPLEDLLPPLTSSNEIDVQLYAIIAVILSQLVQTWYNRITPDGDFIDEIVKIIAHCTRGLEQRLRHADLESLLLDELPFLLDAHLHVVRLARQSSRDFSDADVADRTALIFNTLRPHSALSPTPVDETTKRDEQENEIAWSQLVVDRIVPLVLPPEDVSNPCLSVLVSEIFSQMIVYNAVLGKTSEPWMLWEGVTKTVYSLRPTTKPADDGPAPPPMNRLEQFGLLASGEAPGGLVPRITQRKTFDAAVIMFWSILQQAALGWILLRSLVISFTRAASTEPRPQRNNRILPANKLRVGADNPDTHPQSLATGAGRPIVAMWVWTCFSRLLSLQSRMPWLSGLLSLLQWLSLCGPGRVCCTNSTLDRWMSAQVHEKLLDATLLPPILQAIRSAAFPDNALAPPRVPPTSEQVIEIRRECARAIVAAVPDGVRTLYLSTQDKHLMEEDVEDTLSLFGDHYLNKHLVVAVLELFIVRLFPELADENAVR